MLGRDWKLARWWINYQFDEAVIHFGIHIENKLMERDRDQKLKYSLSELLGERRKAFSSPMDMVHAGVEVIDMD